MATYGAAGKNTYTIPNVVGFFSNEVNSTNGTTQVYIQGPALTQKTVGTYNPSTGKFTPSSDSGLTQQQLQVISSSTGINAIKSASIQTATKGIQATGVDLQTSQQRAQQLVSPNSARRNSPDASSNSDPQGGSRAPTAPQLPGPDQTGELELSKPLTISPDSGLRYPLDMLNEQDRIQFRACEIQKRTQSGQGLQFSFGEIKYTPVAPPVFLSIQSPISDQNSVDWGPDSVNAIDAAIFNASMGLIGTDNISAELSSLIKGFEQTARANQTRLQKYFAGQAAGLNNVLARTDGVVLNPNLELLFQGPQLRPFSFQFKMSARNKDEAKVIKSIIKYFKYHMAVRKEKDKLFLRAPYVFTIRYLKGTDRKHPGINMISPTDDTKACALTNCSVDYTPLGSYMTFRDTNDPDADGTMVAYTLSLQFQEITPIYDTDYKEYPHQIGF